MRNGVLLHIYNILSSSVLENGVKAEMCSKCDCLVVTFVLYLRAFWSVDDNNDIDRNLADLFLSSVINKYKHFSRKMHTAQYIFIALYTFLRNCIKSPHIYLGDCVICTKSFLSDCDANK